MFLHGRVTNGLKRHSSDVKLVFRIGDDQKKKEVGKIVFVKWYFVHIKDTKNNSIIIDNGQRFFFSQYLTNIQKTDYSRNNLNRTSRVWRLRDRTNVYPPDSICDNVTYDRLYE